MVPSVSACVVPEVAVFNVVFETFLEIRFLSIVMFSNRSHSMPTLLSKARSTNIPEQCWTLHTINCLLLLQEIKDKIKTRI
jgi:hypothetical protein